MEHWLADEPVAAYREPWPARAARWGRRHRTAVVAAGVLLLAAAVGSATAAGLVLREQRETLKQKGIAEENYKLVLREQRETLKQKGIAEENYKLVLREQRETLKQKGIAEENYKLARNLSYTQFKYVADNEVRLASTAAGQAARKEMLTSAAAAFRRFLKRDPHDVDLQAKAAVVFRFTANVHRLEGESAEAESLYQESIQLLEALNAASPAEPDHGLNLAQVLRDYANLQAHLGRLREAGESLQRAPALIQAAPDPQDRLVATTLTTAGVNKYSRGLSAEAGAKAAEAAKLFDGLKASPSPYDPVLRAAALNVTALADRDAGRLEAARAAHSEAVGLLLALHQQPPEGVNRDDVAHFLGCCGIEQTRTRIRAEKARIVEKKLTGMAKIWEDHIEWMRRLNWTRTTEQNLTGLVVMWEALARKYPRVPMYREWQGIALRLRGEFRADCGGAARADFEQAAKIAQEMAKQFPEVPGYRGDLGRALLGQGRLAATDGDAATAHDLFKRAAAALSEAVEKAPEEAEDIRSLGEVKAELAK